MKKEKYKNSPLFKSVLFVLLMLYTISIVLVVMWAVFASLKTQNEFRTNVLFWPNSAPWKWKWSNVFYVLMNFKFTVVRTVGGVPTLLTVNMGQQILNTILYAGVGAFLQAIVPCLVAYMTSKFNFKFSKIVYITVIVVMVIPIVGAQPSEIQMLKSLRLYDTFLGTWIQKFNFLGMYYLVFYAMFRGIQKEYSEAAYIDGASELNVLLRIILPLVSTAIMTVMLIKFIDFWNDYQTPMLYLPSHPTLAYGIFNLSNSTLQGLNNVPMRMAGCILMVTPIVVLFCIFKNRLIGNISMGGVKE